ncbi:hypothetical protein NDU88_001841 [Pleurodeles waltl]|uniref:Uncharacterized protein n=1 Tax=Pleurodeles waltl TaxID=8319 RepID=A0AAV7VB70_PLEWA|nr:hypothetical protein NDU88_001841 [Pleurodeles waltl]
MGARPSRVTCLQSLWAQPLHHGCRAAPHSVGRTSSGLAPGAPVGPSIDTASAQQALLPHSTCCSDPSAPRWLIGSLYLATLTELH